MTPATLTRPKIASSRAAAAARPLVEGVVDGDVSPLDAAVPQSSSTRTRPADPVVRDQIDVAELDQLLSVATDGPAFERLTRRLLKALAGVRVVGTSAPAADADGGVRGDFAEFAFLLRGCSRQDPLATYVREIAAIPRMEREDEIRVGQRMEFLRARLQRAILDAGYNKRQAREILDESRMRPLLDELESSRGDAISAAETAALQQARMEYEAARAEFVERSLHVVVAAAAAYRTYGVPLLDLIQEGNAGLIRAVEKFDWRKNVRFRTYAAFWVRQAVERAIAASKGIVRVPNYLQQKMRRLRREGRIPKRNEDVCLEKAAREFELPPRIVGRLLETERATRSLDAPLSDAGETPLSSSIPAEEVGGASLFEWEVPMLNQRIEEVLCVLSDPERTILEYRYGIGRETSMTLEEVGRLMNVSRERVRQLQVRALRKLQAPNLLERLAAFV